MLQKEEREQMINDYKSSVSLWDVFPAFWYNIQIIGHVLRLYLISHSTVKDKILESIINNKGDSELSKIKRPLIISDYESKIPFIFEKFLKEREHISLVEDEYGTIRGLVTMEDIIETILGLEIVDETDLVVDLQALARKKRNIIKNKKPLNKRG